MFNFNFGVRSTDKITHGHTNIGLLCWMNERYALFIALFDMEIPDHKHASVNKFTRILKNDDTSIGTREERHVAGLKKVIWIEYLRMHGHADSFGARARQLRRRDLALNNLIPIGN